MLKSSHAESSGRRIHIAPLFLISLASIAFEISLTRYFATANWSEYGYWVISIAMTGYSVSGILLTLFKDSFLRHKFSLFFFIPLFLMIFSAAGFYYTCLNPFNPLELQNEELWRSQLANIGTYYLTLFPVFFLSGLYIGLNFTALHERITRLYAVDLVGAGAGALFILCAMFYVPPFYLLVVIMPFWLVACFINLPRGFLRLKPLLYFLCVLVFLLCEGSLLQYNKADFFQYKSIYPALHVEGNKVIRRIKSPKGYFHILQNFTERPDAALSNNYSLLGVQGPPLSYGLYRDGNRVTSLPKNASPYIDYARASLDAFPYSVKKQPSVLLIGSSGSFKIREAHDLGALFVTALEPSSILFSLVKQTFPQKNQSAHIVFSSPHSFLSSRPRRFDIIDIASDFLDESEANKYAFTVEAFREELGALNEDGVLSIPVSIKEFTVYALKLVETARQALRNSGVTSPQNHILVYRSAWSVRILVSKKPFAADDIKKLRAFCDVRSFDTSYFPGIENKKIEIYNDLPPISLEDEKETQSEAAHDALRDDILNLLGSKHAAFMQHYFFNLTPATNDRPFFYSVLRLSRIKKIMARISLIPKEEIGELVNVAIFIQALLFALLILFLPAARFSFKGQGGIALVLKSVVYFSCLGLSFLFIEIMLIARLAYFLYDSTTSFAVVLSAMLIFSGLGSFYAGKFTHEPRRGVKLSVCVIIVMLTFYFIFLHAVLSFFIGASLFIKSIVILALVAPLSFVMGFPFSLGLSILKGERQSFVPWAWSINGAFSVIATPLANLVSVSYGYTTVLLLSAVLYAFVLLSFPGAGNENG